MSHAITMTILNNSTHQYAYTDTSDNTIIIRIPKKTHNHTNKKALSYQHVIPLIIVIVGSVASIAVIVSILTARPLRSALGETHGEFRAMGSNAI